MSDETWGPWIEHDGKGCPVPAGTFVMVKFLDPFEVPGSGVIVFRTGSPWREGDYFGCGGDADWVWPINPSYGEADHDVIVIRYRIRKPLGLTILQEIAADPQPVSPERIDA